jgi:adenylate cyclase
MSFNLGITFNGIERVINIPGNVVVLGRIPAEEGVVGVSPDNEIGRWHIELVYDQGEYRIKDLKSRNGTFINGNRIPHETTIVLQPGDAIRLANKTIITIAHSLSAEETRDIKIVDDGEIVHSYSSESTPTEIFLNEEFRAEQFEVLRRQLDTLSTLSESLGTLTEIDDLLNSVIRHIVDVIPNISNYGILLQYNDKLEPFLPGPLQCSMTLAREALRKKQTLHWRYNANLDIKSVRDYNIESALYAPLVWQSESYGVLFVNNNERQDAFSDDDVRLIQAMARQSAMFIKNVLLQVDLRQREIVRANLMRHFSPQVAKRVLEQQEELQLGGESISPVTLLMSDVRGFTALTAAMLPDAVMRMLNQMFSILTPIIFKHHGTVDKYIGDGVLAIFGSPEPDNSQWVHAIRAALEMQQAMTTLQNEIETTYGVILQIGIAIHTGELVHGYLGSYDRLEYTVIGDTVNKVARLCDNAPRLQVIISEAVYEKVKGQVQVRPERIAAISKHADTEPQQIAYIVTACNDR